jgi:hypothetical protein
MTVNRIRLGSYKSPISLSIQFPTSEIMENTISSLGVDVKVERK